MDNNLLVESLSAHFILIPESSLQTAECGFQAIVLKRYLANICQWVFVSTLAWTAIAIPMGSWVCFRRWIQVQTRSNFEYTFPFLLGLSTAPKPIAFAIFIRTKRVMPFLVLALEMS
ncbi:MAG: hypothetical protein HC851_17995 [Acaryochloris sp. RU_4_1]|nr:hypothetical protein [Acaryochloris sp. RU_4_1]NJR56360.1 hypothetical protein [Acaryochloris sp. CRU_2_0]